jgi:carbonic anhydrase
MDKSFKKILCGYQKFREKYSSSDSSILQYLSAYGQHPQIMVISCCDSRVDPALILQCDPGDLFVVRNVANIVPPFEKDDSHHGTSAALEFAVRFLNIKHLILLGHSQCSGIQTLLNQENATHNDFISNWVSLVDMEHCKHKEPDDYAKLALKQSHKNCLSFPWIKEKVTTSKLTIHLWFFDIKQGQIFRYCDNTHEYQALDPSTFS